MKKVLLLSAAFIVSMGVSAQMHKAITSFKGKIANELTVSSSLKLSDKAPSYRIKKVAPAKAEEANSSIFGSYVINHESSDGEFTGSNLGMTMESTTATFEGDDREYNVLITNLFGVDDQVIAYYDEDAKTLSIPCNQIILESAMGYDENDEPVDLGPLTYLTLVETEDGIYYSEDDTVFELNDDGSFDVSGDIYGIASYLPEYVWTDDETGEEHTGTGYDFLFAPRVLPCNATLSCTTNSKTLVGFPNENGSWMDVDIPLNVEYYETSLTINGFAGRAPVDVEINDDGTCNLLLLTRMSETDYSKYQAGDDGKGVGPMILHYAFVDDEGYIDVDWDQDKLPGAFVEDNEIYFFTVRQGEDGKYYYDNFGIVVPCTKTFNRGQNWYSGGYFYGMDLTFDLGNNEDPTGIQNANNTLEYRLKNTPTYNLMGQQVNRSQVKGIMVRNGKKYIAK